LVATFLGLGVAVIITMITLLAVFGSGLHALTEARDAHDRVASALKSDCSSDFACLQVEAAQDSAAFGTFIADMRRLANDDLPGGADDELADLLAVSESLRGAYDQLANAPNENEFNRLIGTLQLRTLITRWNEAYKDFEDALL
jgi:hypothetical protein